MNRPIHLHPQNRRLFEFRGQPVVLVCATEHYGAVLNRPFDFAKYLADAAEKKQTLTRLFVLFREQQSSVNPYSTCKPESPDYIAPYLRTGPGKAQDGQPKFDLDQWNPEFFERLHRFLALASDYGIIVEVTLLSNTYSPQVWALNPLNHLNNNNGLEAIDWPEYMSMRHHDLYQRQIDHVRKIVAETNRYDNVIYEICNEPGGNAPGYDSSPTTDEVDRWLKAVADVIRETELPLPNKHLISGQQAFDYQPFTQLSDQAFSDFTQIDVVNIHPLPNTDYHGERYDMGNFMSKELKLSQLRDYCLATIQEEKPLNLDEDNVASQYKDYDGWTIHRKRAWTALFCGCHYDYIDFSINIYLESGTEESRRHIRTWIKHLSGFIHSLDLASARPLPGYLREKPPHAVESILAVENQDYCVYLADGRELDEAGAGSAIEGDIVLDLPQGTYKTSCFSPTTGLYSPAVVIQGGSGTRVILPEFIHDIVIQIRKVNGYE